MKRDNKMVIPSIRRSKDGEREIQKRKNSIKTERDTGRERER